MSHLIAAYPTHNSPRNLRYSAVLSRSAMDPLNRRIYELLNVSDYYATAGGSDDGRYFTAAELNEALHRLVDAPDIRKLREEANFLLNAYQAARDENKGFVLEPNQCLTEPGKEKPRRNQLYIHFS